MDAPPATASPAAASRSARALRRPLAAARERWLRASPLAREVALVLLAKAAVLGLIWWAFFSAPAAPRMAMDPQRVEGRLLHDAPPAEAQRADP